MLRLGCAKPASWASFWAMLTLVGLATRAGERAVGAGGSAGQGGGQHLPALAAHGVGAVSSGQGEHRSERGQRPQRGGGAGPTGGGPNDKKTLPLPTVPGSWLQAEADGMLSAFRSFQVTAWGGGTRKLITHSSPALPFSISLPLTHRCSALSQSTWAALCVCMWGGCPSTAVRRPPSLPGRLLTPLSTWGSCWQHHLLLSFL